MDKWTGIVVSIFLAFMFGGQMIANSIKEYAAIDMAKAGLEECPIRVKSNITIWVKDCSAYHKNQKNRDTE